MFRFKRIFLLKIFGVTCLFWFVLNRFYYHTSKPQSINEIREIIERLNEDQTIYNLHKFGPLTNDTIIIGIQVHDRLLYLQWMITSLSKARDIDKTLLIFSHDWYDETINDLVRSIRFAMVLQIFFPYSVQLHPQGFPGYDPYYCEDEVTAQDLAVDSTNSSSRKCYIPKVRDRYAHLVQVKHHWWWKANTIFSRLECTVNHTGLVVFLEDDHYILEDFIYIVRLMRAKADVECPQCHMLYLGRVTADFVFRNDSAKLEIITWGKDYFQNIGLTMNRTVWYDIVSMQRDFCRFNDYNWDASLLNVSFRRLKGPFKFLIAKAPRVLHFGKCGLHARGRNCSNVRLMKVIQIMTRSCRRKMFPANLTIVNVESSGTQRRMAGGWKDRRDRELCVNMTKMQRSKKTI